VNVKTRMTPCFDLARAFAWERLRTDRVEEWFGTSHGNIRGSSPGEMMKGAEKERVLEPLME